MHIFSLLSAVFLPATILPATDATCRCVPSEPCWPSIEQWKALNATISGQLIKTLPIAHACHDPIYDADMCELVKTKWSDPDWRTGIAESIFATSFVNDTCDPADPREEVCHVGGYPQYIINATSPSHVSAGLAFSKKHDVRVVVKNTGHDYLGRSVGYGSLSLWTHNLKSMEVFDYTSLVYSGPAIKVGAGVQVLEAYQLVDLHGYMMVGGECGSVGLAGGFTAGGGQSPLSSYAGLSADQALEFEVVLADGQFVRAAPDENPDLYWAMSGGGPGYGVVWSVILKIHADVLVTGTVLSFQNNNNSETYWKAVEAWHSLVPSITDMGGYTYTSISARQFRLGPLFVPNRGRSEVLSLMSPFHDRLEDLGIEYSSNTASHPTFLNAWEVYFEQGAAGETPHISSRLLDRSTFTDDVTQVTGVVRSIVNDGGSLVQMAIGASRAVAGNPTNSVNPGWRDASMHILAISGDPDSKESIRDHQVTDVWGDRLRSLSPNSGAYVNEADPYEPNFQEAFYGNNYARLLSIKQRYDPDSVFYATTGVGSEDWVATSDGRLCRA